MSPDAWAQRACSQPLTWLLLAGTGSVIVLRPGIWRPGSLRGQPAPVSLQGRPEPGGDPRVLVTIPLQIHCAALGGQPASAAGPQFPLLCNEALRFESELDQAESGSPEPPPEFLLEPQLCHFLAVAGKYLDSKCGVEDMNVSVQVDSYPHSPSGRAGEGVA